jgi:hypothetical protein
MNWISDYRLIVLDYFFWVQEGGGGGGGDMDRMLFQNGHHNIFWNKVRVAAPCCHRKPAEIYFGCDGWGDLEAGVGRTKKLLSVVRFQACAGIKSKPNNDTV